MTPAELHDAIQAAARDAAAVSLEGREADSPKALLEGPATVLRSVVDRALEALASLQSPREGDELSDIAFLAKWEFARSAESLARLPGSDDAAHISTACAAVQQQIVMSLTAVERALCNREGVPPRLGHLYAKELQRSIALRQVYAAFRSAVLHGGEPDAKSLPARLLRASKLIDELHAGRGYRSLRIAERVQLGGLRERIEKWLGGADGWDAHAGMLLWKDLSTFADLLTAVNGRAELQHHDRNVAVELLSTLPSAAGAALPLSDDQRVALLSLRGRDERLDRLLEKQPLPISLLRETLAELLDSLDDTARPRGPRPGGELRID